ncbi:hypothetical protein HBI25_193950 [Parastagonospora nodorum]|nr:hypothetical protein HBH82_185000 [Parastagonospora nodorum]KAH4663698.1 hypothetical protein HBH78_211440 [Parastagonospora nodorum]KAH4698304.1 hypothetical protein HBH67_175960 [Parastagonospora nodorum]KAH4759230.1 hypothetical protein HBH63_221430 [Parastagonospora nodorum]KAH4774246.1 hypothetical protein HBH62_185940 [Parastagonospora nodorum]
MHEIIQDVDCRCSISSNHSRRTHILYLGLQIAAIDASQRLASLGSLKAVDLRLEQFAAFDFGKILVATRFADSGHSIPVVYSGKYHSAAALVMCTASNEDLGTTFRYDPKLSGMQLFVQTEVRSGRDLMVYQNLSTKLCLAVKALLKLLVLANRLLRASWTSNKIAASEHAFRMSTWQIRRAQPLRLAKINRGRMVDPHQ